MADLKRMTEGNEAAQRARQYRLSQLFDQSTYTPVPIFPSDSDILAAQGVNSMANAERFHAAVQGFPLSTNIEDRRPQAYRGF